ncbi:hypothetical protein IPL68_02480 [Candidatus Saccharibacteria bacterium]|nr:MAG: hypothetical protein IPL68_02480 [Candidatus Saccharibacteria bacterium]
MYRVDKRTHRHARAKRRMAVLLVIFISGIGVYWLTHLTVSPKQNIKSSPSISRKFNATTETKVRIEKPEFIMELPGGWKEVAVTPQPLSPTYTFISPTANATRLNVYMSAMPGFAINRAIVVTPQADGLAYDSVSENCTTFTDATKIDPATGHAQARWQGVDFLCDTGNFARAVVGIISREGMNQVTVTGQTIGSRKIFITYTDNSVNPDYSVLYSVLTSLRFK